MLLGLVCSLAAVICYLFSLANSLIFINKSTFCFVCCEKRNLACSKCFKESSKLILIKRLLLQVKNWLAVALFEHFSAQVSVRFRVAVKLFIRIKLSSNTFPITNRDFSFLTILLASFCVFVGRNIIPSYSRHFNRIWRQSCQTSWKLVLFDPNQLTVNNYLISFHSLSW